MQRYFTSVMRLYQRIVELAACVFTPRAPDAAADELTPPQPATSGPPSVPRMSARQRVVSQRAAERTVDSRPAVVTIPVASSHAIAPPARITPPASIDPAMAKLIKQLRAADGVTRSTVAKRIQTHGTVAVPALIPLVSDGEWQMRYWAAHLLKDMADPAALPALQRQLPLESDRIVKEEITKTIKALRIFKVTESRDPGQLPVGMQGRLDELRRELMRAYQSQNRTEADRVRNQLVKLQVELVERLRSAPLGQDERRRLVKYYQNGSAHKRLLKRSANAYHNTCWVCRTNVDLTVNTTCSCGWLICVCGACQCPDFSIGQRDHQPECQQQIARLGLPHYHELIEERQRVYGGWSNFARVDFSR